MRQPNLIATAFFSGLSTFYGVTLPGLLAGSGLIALVLGLALQDTLGNIFAGLGLQAGKAFRVGDWLIVDGKHCEVIEVNWRSTRLRNIDAASFDIPNNQLAKATIVNLYNPTPVHAARASVCVEYGIPPNHVKDALVQAALAARGVLSSPAPAAFLMSFDDSGIRYELKYWIDDARYETLDVMAEKAARLLGGLARYLKTSGKTGSKIRTPLPSCSKTTPSSSGKESSSLELKT